MAAPRGFEMSDMPTKSTGRGSYVIAGLGFIPLIGVVFAIIAIVLGVMRRRSGGKTLILLGFLGIATTVVLYGGIFYFGFVQRGGIYDSLRGRLAKTTLTELVKSIEYYKVTKGQYPRSLPDLRASLGKESFTSIYDPTDPQIWTIPPAKERSTFFYQLTDDGTHYYLLGVGPDRRAFTSDDLLPDVSEQDRAKTGLLINPASLPAK
jgi:hypothetical protein